MPSNEAVGSVTKGIKGYVLMFSRAFPGDKDPLTVENLADAVGAHERALLTPAPFDDFSGGDAGALTETQQTGLRSFLDDGCGACHAGAFKVPVLSERSLVKTASIASARTFGRSS